jgi:hypothetical protein
VPHAPANLKLYSTIMKSVMVLFSVIAGLVVSESVLHGDQLTAAVIPSTPPPLVNVGNRCSQPTSDTTYRIVASHGSWPRGSITVRNWLRLRRDAGCRNGPSIRITMVVLEEFSSSTLAWQGVYRQEDRCFQSVGVR